MASQHAFIIKLLQVNHNRTVDLQELNRSPIPAPLVFGLTALDMLGYEPIAARWFRLDDKGAVHYLSADEIATFDKSPNGKKQTERNRFFGNVELTFKKSGEPNAPTQTWRHMGTNLRDDALPGSPTLAYLNSLGSPISGMTKAASYLIWRDDFSVIRNYMLDHMTFMVSDTTGITPYHAAEKGFVQETWGTFQGNMFEGAKKGELADDDRDVEDEPAAGAAVPVRLPGQERARPHDGHAQEVAFERSIRTSLRPEVDMKALLLVMAMCTSAAAAQEPG